MAVVVQKQGERGGGAVTLAMVMVVVVVGLEGEGRGGQMAGVVQKQGGG